jgi:hypothetical protein
MSEQLDLFGPSSPTLSPVEIVKAQQEPDPRSPTVVSYGGGRNSTALLILCQKLGIKVDLILFADTGGEKPETYDFLHVFSRWLKKNGMPQISIVRKSAGGVSSSRKTLVYAKNSLFFLLKACAPIEWVIYSLWWVGIAGHSFETLEENCLASQTLPSKAYGKSSCSVMWKVEPQEEFEKNWDKAVLAWEQNIPVRKLIGYHAAEPHRLINKKTGRMRDLEDGRYRYEYPLIKYGIDNFACMQIILDAGLPLPPKSSCFFCPSTPIGEVRQLDPALRARGELIEQVALNGIHWQGDTSVKGLGRKFAWSEIGSLSDLEQAFFAHEASARSCTCID